MGQPPPRGYDFGLMKVHLKEKSPNGTWIVALYNDKTYQVTHGLSDEEAAYFVVGESWDLSAKQPG